MKEVHMDPLGILAKYIPADSKGYDVLLTHSTCVRDKALALVRNIPDVDTEFIAEAAMLHDIGSIFCKAPQIGFHGKERYIRHGILGKDLLEKESLPRHARVCERHIGAGLTEQEIVDQQLPLPHRDMLPETIEEKAICFADCFFSKDPDHLTRERTCAEAQAKIARFGKAGERFDALARLFGVNR